MEYCQLTVFKGTYRHRIDPKGRLPVPAAFRRLLHDERAEAVVITVLDQCLAGYAPGEWAGLEAQLRALPAFSKPVKSLVRLLASRALDCPVDGQGRILIPAGLRQAAGLSRDVVIVGVLNRFEVWAPEAWEGFLKESERILDDVTLDVQWPPPPGPPAAGAGAPVRPQGKPSR